MIRAVDHVYTEPEPPRPPQGRSGPDKSCADATAVYIQIMKSVQDPMLQNVLHWLQSYNKEQYDLQPMQPVRCLF